MAFVIRVGKPTRRAYGNEYPVAFVKNKRVVNTTVVFGSEIRSKDVRYAFTKDFENARIVRVKNKSFKEKIGYGGMY